MENLEEVLQALDEFQKMRPSEIPRELEDYLCWVAKTGDPVYQWSLIKTLFREKLTRVITDFYESCPTLELTPCPNVEHFNYDTMKSNLLERLESFANAPFTVQRICELLTAPRKEYNRVDKFMRAIEKNILVVSTREPGPIARRSENGDGMVNGSMEEDTSVTQPPQDVEMEYWEKDCPSTVTISVHTVENDTPLLHTVIPTATVVKNAFATDESSQEKLESTSSKTETTVSNFIPTTSEFSGVSSITSQVQTQDSSIPPAIQNMSTLVSESPGIVSDVPEAIMNEDTSSQPSLDLESEESDSTDSNRKLQTTFQAKDFTSNEDKSSKFYVDNSKPNEKVEDSETQVEETTKALNSDKLDSEPKSSNVETVNPTVEDLTKAPDEKLEDKLKCSSEMENVKTVVKVPGTDVENEDAQSLENTNVKSTPAACVEDIKSETFKSYVTEKCSTPSLEEPTSPSILSQGDKVHRIPCTDVRPDESIDTPESGDTSLNLKSHNIETEPTEDQKPIVEEPSFKDNNETENFNCNQEKDNLTITEAVEDETRVTKSMVPDPIPIIEEPKDIETTQENNASSIVEISEDSENPSSSATCRVEDRDKSMSVESSNLTELQENNIPTVIKVKTNDSPVESTACKRGRQSVELMEVDEEESLSVLHEDEPMDQEPVDQEMAELSKS